MNYAQYREKVEWANYWWDNAFEKRNDRMLMVGDSTSRAYRSTLAKYLGRPVDFFGTSSAVTDQLFWKELTAFLSVEEYTYDSIHVQIGVHGIVSESGISLPSGYEITYADCFEELVNILKKNCKRLVLATITQVVILPNNKIPIIGKLYTHLHPVSWENSDPRFESGILARNEIIRNTARKHRLPCNDLYIYMIREGNRFRHIDHVHYEKNAELFLAKRTAEYMLGERE